MNTLDPIKFASAGAITSAICMLVLSIASPMGMYEGAMNMMRQWHMYYNISTSGILIGMLEAVVISFVFFYIFATIYNALLKK
ncbi:MAG: DUF5676 family membrane protein [bacterium]|nr:DUF5676 family membrane protein [bacterium]